MKKQSEDYTIFYIVFGVLAVIVTMFLLVAKSRPDAPPPEPRNFEEYERRMKAEGKSLGGEIKK